MFRAKVVQALDPLANRVSLLASLCGERVGDRFAEPGLDVGSGFRINEYTLKAGKEVEHRLAKVLTCIGPIEESESVSDHLCMLWFVAKASTKQSQMSFDRILEFSTLKMMLFQIIEVSL